MVFRIVIGITPQAMGLCERFSDLSAQMRDFPMRVSIPAFVAVFVDGYPWHGLIIEA
jgi:hypothetical protein